MPMWTGNGIQSYDSRCRIIKSGHSPKKEFTVPTPKTGRQSNLKGQGSCMPFWTGNGIQSHDSRRRIIKSGHSPNKDFTVLTPKASRHSNLNFSSQLCQSEQEMEYNHMTQDARL